MLQNVLEAYVAEALSALPVRLVPDPLFGSTIFFEKEARLLETAEMVRLRYIKQLSTLNLFYPTAEHSRFHHSVGVANLIRRFLDIRETELVDKGLIDLQDIFRLISAALLHDVGHSAWSHAGELFARYQGDPRTHESVSSELVKGNNNFDKFFDDWGLIRIRDIITNQNDRVLISKMIQGKPPVLDTDPQTGNPISDANKSRQEKARRFLGQLISGPCDMDRTEYLIRDSFFTGIALGRFDAGSMLSKVGPISVAGRNELGFLDRVFGESFVITRELMYAGVYYDARNVTALEMLVRAWSKLYGSNVDNLWFKTDYAVLDDMMASANKFVKRMAKLIRSCRIYDVSDEFRLKELNVTQRECLLRLADKPSKLLEFESAICGSNRVNIREGDLIIGIRIWKCPTDLLATPVFTETGPKNLGESELLKSLYNDSYKLERSKIVISTFEKGKRKRKAITEEVLKQLAKT